MLTNQEFITGNTHSWTSCWVCVPVLISLTHTHTHTHTHTNSCVYRTEGQNDAEKAYELSKTHTHTHTQRSGQKYCCLRGLCVMTSPMQRIMGLTHTIFFSHDALCVICYQGASWPAESNHFQPDLLTQQRTNTHTHTHTHTFCQKLKLTDLKLLEIITNYHLSSFFDLYH